MITPIVEEGVTFTAKVDENGEYSALVIDDKNVAGKTLVERRLNMLRSGTPLFNIKIAVFYLGDLLKLAGQKTWFIDSSGKMFKYVKKRFAILSCHKVTNIIPDNVGGAVLEVDGVASRFKILYAPSHTSGYAGIIHLSLFEKVFYGFFDYPFKDTRRKV